MARAPSHGCESSVRISYGYSRRVQLPRLIGIPIVFEVLLNSVLQGLFILMIHQPNLDEFYVWLECDGEEIEEYDLRTLSSESSHVRWPANLEVRRGNKRNVLICSACIAVILTKLSPSLL